MVYRKQQFYAFFLCLFQHVQSVLQIVVLTKRSTDLSALCLGEGISHTASDNQCIHFVQQTVDNGNLAGNFCAAQDRYERTGRMIHCVAKEIDLFLHQISYHAGIYIFGNTHIGAVCTVCGSECVVYIYVAQRSQLLAEFIFVLCLFCTVTCILKKDHIAVFHCLNSSLCVWSDYLRIRSKFYFLSKQLGKARCHRCQRQLRFRLSLRFSEMRTQDDSSSVSDQFFDRRQSCYQTVFVGNLSIDQRNVEVTSYQNFLAFYINVIN